MFLNQTRQNAEACMQRSVGNIQAAPKQASEVDIELDELRQAVGELSAVTDNLLGRLVPVTIPCGLGEAGNSAQSPEATLSPIADQIRNEARRVRLQSESLRAATNRLAV